MARVIGMPALTNAPIWRVNISNSSMLRRCNFRRVVMIST